MIFHEAWHIHDIVEAFPELREDITNCVSAFFRQQRTRLSELDDDYSRSRRAHQPFWTSGDRFNYDKQHERLWLLEHTLKRLGMEHVIYQY